MSAKLTIKNKNLFLYLAIACFVGILAIFVFAGYMGIYDTVYVTTGEYEQTIGPDFWVGQQGRNSYPYSIGAMWGESVKFRYEIDNRRFSAYAAAVDVSLWKSSEKVLELLHKDILINSFDKTVLDFTLTPQQLQQAGLEIGQYTIRITRGNMELGQGIVLGFNQAVPLYPPKPVPALP